MEPLFLLRKNCYSGIYFGGIFPQEIEDYIFEIVWFLKINDFNRSFKKLFSNLNEINLPLTENCTLEESLDMYTQEAIISFLRYNLFNVHYKKLTSPYKWWNTRLNFNLTYKQIYFIDESEEIFNNNWYYQEEYDISSTRFRFRFLEKNEFQLENYANSQHRTKYVKTFNQIPVTEEEWSNRGVNNKNHSLFPIDFKNHNIVYHFDIEEPLPLDFATICYYV